MQVSLAGQPSGKEPSVILPNRFLRICRGLVDIRSIRSCGGGFMVN